MHYEIDRNENNCRIAVRRGLHGSTDNASKRITMEQTARSLILRHEGTSLKLYKDSLGLWTIGTGRLLDPSIGGGISEDEALYMLDADIAKAHNACEVYPWFARLSDARAAAMINLCFNLGAKRLAGFVKFLTAMSVSDWDTAAQELRSSKWFNQVGRRGPEIINLIQHESWPI